MIVNVTSPSLEKVKKGLDGLPATLRAEEQKAMSLSMLFLQKTVKAGLQSGSKARGAKKAVRRRSGYLSGTVNVRTFTKGDEVTGAIGSYAKQANILNWGGDVVPTEKKWLTIPVSGGPALTPSGVPRGSAPDFALRFFVNPNDPTTAYLVGRDDNVLYYVLKKHVTIPEHAWLTGPVEANEKKIVKYVENAVAEAKKREGLK